ncbi:hypothetical protein COW53_04570 [bacterium CG17_big_fil_post_rev_8_21_14_2_50_64_8]|nr:MAG: hypothetical protein COW53_04570 [bacterium CG17_big_fil_post_rev_8_21_14_2_50_64_8]PJA76291.1 MAG: hypothetical protein CO151_03000 [bacterium CG_4_9_14_3_um_filter_65_15]
MKLIRIMSLLALVLMIFGCSQDNSTTTPNSLIDVRTDLAIDSPSQNVGSDFTIDPKSIPLHEVGLPALFGPDKLPPCITLTDVYGFVWTLNISGGTSTGTCVTTSCGTYDVRGTGKTVTAYYRGSDVNCADWFTYYVTTIDKPSRTASGTWTNSAGSSGSWSGSGGPCK